MWLRALSLGLLLGGLAAVVAACTWSKGNQTDATNERLRGAALTLLTVGGRTHTPSGPYGCEPTLAPGASRAGSFATNLPPSQCQEPAALVFGAARIGLGF
jgi:hypothetical protein